MTNMNYKNQGERKTYNKNWASNRKHIDVVLLLIQWVKKKYIDSDDWIFNGTKKWCARDSWKSFDWSMAANTHRTHARWRYRLSLAVSAQFPCHSPIQKKKRSHSLPPPFTQIRWPNAFLIITFSIHFALSNCVLTMISITILSFYWKSIL